MDPLKKKRRNNSTIRKNPTEEIIKNGAGIRKDERRKYRRKTREQLKEYIVRVTK